MASSTSEIKKHISCKAGVNKKRGKENGRVIPLEKRQQKTVIEPCGEGRKCKYVVIKLRITCQVIALPQSVLAFSNLQAHQLAYKVQ